MFRLSRLAPLVCMFAIGLAISCAAAAVAAEPVEYNRDIRPILSDKCIHCHGPDQEGRQADLRLDLSDDAMRPADSGKVAIVPGKPEASELVRRIFSADEDERMPPPDSHKSLTDKQKELLKRWIAEGAKYQIHWSYAPLARPVVPTDGGERSGRIPLMLSFFRNCVPRRLSRVVRPTAGRC